MIVKNFQYLIALDREGHFGRAAKSCNVSQPTLSAGIKQLEGDLGVEIVRHGRRYDGLTLEGETVLAWAIKIERDCDGMERDLSALKRGLEGKICLGVVSATSAVGAILSVALADQIPLLAQTVTTSDTASLLRTLLDHEMDMALTYLSDVPKDEFDTHHLYREHTTLFQVSKEPQPKRVTWDHVVDLPLCILESGLPRVAQAQLANCSAATIHTDSIDIVAAHVATGRYAAVLPQSLATRLAHIPNLQATAVTGAGSHTDVGFAIAKGEVKSPPSAALLELVHTPKVVTALKDILALHRQFQPGKG
jgi:DNA-binding transcriptional LysR family regulator